MRLNFVDFLVEKLNSELGVPKIKGTNFAKKVVAEFFEKLTQEEFDSATIKAKGLGLNFKKKKVTISNKVVDKPVTYTKLNMKLSAGLKRKLK